MHNSRQVVYVAFMNDHLPSIYLSIYTTKTCDFNKSHSTNENHEEPKTCGSSKPTNFLHFYIFSTYIHLGTHDCNMIFIQSYWLQYDIHPIVLIAINFFFPIMCYKKYNSSFIKNLHCMDNPTYPMGGFYFFWDNLWRKTESNPKFYVGKAVYVGANFVKLGRQCPWTRYCVWARTCARLNIFFPIFFFFWMSWDYLFIYPCFGQSKPFQNHFIFKNFFNEISPLKIKKEGR
jgi:hypothetical protein